MKASQKHNYRSVSLHFTIYELLQRLALKMNDKKLSIPNTIVILAETKDMKFLLDEKNL